MKGFPKWWRALVSPAVYRETEGEGELKFHIPGTRCAEVESWLRVAMRPHALFPKGTVCSIYFDSPLLRLLGEKENSDYLKTKIRLRWYADVAGDVPVHLEIKEKVGARRVKRRIPLPIHPEELIRLPLEHPEWLRIVDTWLPQPWRHLLPLWPVIELRYWRLRFVLPGAVDAFCLDTRIRGERFHSRLLVPAPTRDLGFGVFEQKGPSVEAHPVLRTIPRFGGRRQACSKYSMIASQALGEDLN